MQRIRTTTTLECFNGPCYVSFTIRSSEVKLPPDNQRNGKKYVRPLKFSNKIIRRHNCIYKKDNK